MTFEKSLSGTFSVLVMALVLLRGTATADGINGTVELFNNISDTTTTDATGLRSKTKTVDFLQRYRLLFDNAIYPFVSLRGSGIFEKEAASTESGDMTTKRTTTKIIPLISLNLNNPFVTAGVSYEKREEKTGDPAMRNFREVKNASLALRPEGLPSLEMLLSKTHLYDKEHMTSDLEMSNYSLSSRYAPVKDLTLQYLIEYSENNNLLTRTDSELLGQTGRAAYRGLFFNGRASLNTSYTINRTEFKSTSSGGSGVRVPLFPIAGLSSINDTPTVGVLDQNPALIDGNVFASSGLNIGRLPSLGGDTKKRNAGLDFGIETEVNYLYVWVDRELPAAVAGSFSWEIYTSSDGQNWSLYQTVFPATFNLFENRFEIAFTNVKTRYIKAAVRPLSAAVPVPLGVDLSNIFITELRPLIDKPAAQNIGTNSITSQISDLGIRVSIVRTDTQSLFYDMYFANSRLSDQPSSRFVLNNALTGSQRFTKVLSGNARVARENDGNPDGSRSSASSYNATLVASIAPLPTLNNSLSLNAHREDRDGNTTNSRSLFLSNTADWYPGINTGLSGGISSTASDAAPDTENTVVNFGVNVIPHRALALSANYTDSETRQSGDNQNINTFSRSTSMSISYNPFSSLYAVGSISEVSAKDQKRQTLQNYNISWAVQRGGGAVQFNFVYNETWDPTANIRTRVLGPEVRWKINPQAVLDVFYLITTGESQTLTSETRSIFTSFKLNI